MCTFYVIYEYWFDLHYDYTVYNTWLCNLGEHMIMLVFLDSEAVFTHVIVGTFLTFVSGAHNREQITLITPEKKRILLKQAKTNKNQISEALTFEIFFMSISTCRIMLFPEARANVYGC